MLHTLIHVTLQLGLLLPLNVDDARVFSASERLAQEHVKKYKTGAAELKDLIQQVLHHQDFNPQDVDHDMHQRLMDCIAQYRWFILGKKVIELEKSCCILGLGEPQAFVL